MLSRIRFLTAGESHGPALAVIVEGLPANMPLTAAEIDRELARRQCGYGRGGRMKIERDRVQIVSGVRLGNTLGGPVAMLIGNRDWENWRAVMQSAPGPAAEPATTPRPGHADLPGALKFGFQDVRNVLERASARETAARTAAGAVARKLLALCGVRIYSRVTGIGPVTDETAFHPPRGRRRIEQSPLRCLDPAAETAMIGQVDRARENGDTLGGVFEVIVSGLPVGLGSCTQWDLRLDGRLAQALMSIQGVKGVAVGAGFAAAVLPGSVVHDEIFHSPGRGFHRRTNRAGGLEGGMTNGELLVLRGAMKPIASLTRPLASADLLTGQPVAALRERSDVCAVPAAGVVGEAMTALVLADALLEKYGGDSLAEIRARCPVRRGPAAGGVGR